MEDGSSTPPVVQEAVETARRARLHYVDEDTPGITRRPWGRGFSYFDSRGQRLTDARKLERIRSLVIPPAWKEVWIAPTPEGHIQATGRDQRGRKQYIYHPRWQELRNQTKFDRLLVFGRQLPGLRALVDRDLARRGLPKSRAAAFVVRLLDITLQRIGNPEYARANRSYGLSTLREKHVEIRTTRLHLNFPGKGGKLQQIDIRDRRLARLARKFQELPGQDLIRYLDENGDAVTLTSDDINAYLADFSEEHFTAKTFRTWGATVLTAAELCRLGPSNSPTAARKSVTRAIRKTARRLGNTLAICRRYYVHPAVVEAYNQQELPSCRQAAEGLADEEADGLSVEEKTILLLLQKETA